MEPMVNLAINDKFILDKIRIKDLNFDFEKNEKNS